MSRGYTVLLYCTSLLLDVTVGRCFTLAVVLLTYTVLLLVIVFNNDGSRGPTDILLQYCISALDTVLLSEHTRHVQCWLSKFPTHWLRFYFLIIEKDYLNNGSKYSHYWKIVGQMKVLKVLNSDINVYLIILKTIYSC